MDAKPVAVRKYRRRMERWFWPASHHSKEQMEALGKATLIDDTWHVECETDVTEYYFRED
jgi:hypothetical protein